MPRVTWPIQNEAPVIRINLTKPSSGSMARRMCLADTGAGPRSGPISFVLSENDCHEFALRIEGNIKLGGAIPGVFPVYSLDVRIEELGIVRRIHAAAVPVSKLPHGVDGIACLSFINLFTYGNFGDPSQFGLETP